MSAAEPGEAILELTDADAWRAWLERHHTNGHGVVLRIKKKRAKRALIGIEAALDVALCFGFIDSVRWRFDDETFLQRYSPRRAKSPWSAINVARAETLMAEGRMHPSGLEEVRRARADGRFAASARGALRPARGAGTARGGR
jgi:uncharacterized protein YdeI (YjbR/CyaY-like superfamily)